MRSFYVFSLFVILQFPFAVQAQADIDEVVFEYGHSMRIPFHEVKIRMTRTEKNIVRVYVRAKPSNDDAQWKYSDISKHFDIALADFEKLCLELTKLEKIDPAKAYEEVLDGYGCRIEYGSKGKKVSYSYSCPDSAAAKRRLTEYVEICRQILVLGQLDPDEIFAKKGDATKTRQKGVDGN